MHPALSIIFFTTSSGAGFALLTLLGLGVPLGLLPPSGSFARCGASIAALLTLPEVWPRRAFILAGPSVRGAPSRDGGRLGCLAKAFSRC